MKKILLQLILVLTFFGVNCSILFAQVPPINDECSKAITIRSVSGYCSQPGEFTNVNATSTLAKAQEWPSAGLDVWFKFVATAYDVNLNVYTGGSFGTLTNPQVAIYRGDCENFNQEIGTFYPGNSTATYYKGGLTVGKIYYIRVSGANNSTGTFQLCIDNYFPPTKPGQDFSNASLLCSKDAFTQTNVTGAGFDNREAAGTCLDINSNGGSIEANAAWYKWIAANNGTLTFNIIPTNNNDDLDWVLYDLGTISSPKPINAANAIRCAAGSGVTCSPKYYITGANLASNDITEQGGCVAGQDGFVKFIDMQQDHLYALLINNFSTGSNGFRLEFGGTGEFVGPAPKFKVENDYCDNVFRTIYTADEKRTGYTYFWDFGDLAQTKTSTSAGPVTVNYSGPGGRVVTLQIKSPLGCTSYSSYFFQDLGVLPQATILSSPSSYCIGDTIKLKTSNKPEGAEAIWTLPNGKEILIDELVIPVKSDTLSGTYKLKYRAEVCISDSSSIDISILKIPIASFDVNPKLNQIYTAPFTLSFINTSQNAKSYLWDFGDGNTSTLASPTHTYDSPGSYSIKLTAFNDQCSAIATIPILKILNEGDILVPNAFTPNGDGNNDFFNVLIANLKSYQIDIFNRYGDKIFSADSILESWDGKYRGKEMPVGVYYFIINGEDFSGNKLFEKNSVTLLR